MLHYCSQFYLNVLGKLNYPVTECRKFKFVKFVDYEFSNVTSSDNRFAITRANS